jgi:hypothetical protein
VMIANLTGVTCNFSVVLICISFMVKGVEHCSVYLLTVCIFSENCLFN